MPVLPDLILNETILDVMVNWINAWICAYIYILDFICLNALLSLEFSLTPLYDQIYGGTIVERIGCDDIEQKGLLKRNMNPLVSLLSDGIYFLSMIICCCLLHHLNIIYFNNNMEKPINFCFVRHIIFLFV